MSSPRPSRPRSSPARSSGRSGARPAIAAGATALALLLVPSVASARIVPGSSIAGVKLGASVEDVRGVLGTPRRISHPSNEITGTTTVYAYRGLTVTFGPGSAAEATVIAVSSGRRAERTARGIGVGSSRGALRRAYPKVRCEAVGRRAVCTLGALKPGARVTTFRIAASNRVGRVEVGLVID